MIGFVKSNLAIILTGSIVSLFTPVIMNIGHKGIFTSEGTLSKKRAAAWRMIVLLFSGVLSPFIHQYISIPLANTLGILTLLGLAVIAVGFLNNYDVTDWKLINSGKSIEIYSIGIALILLDFYMLGELNLIAAIANNFSFS